MYLESYLKLHLLRKKPVVGVFLVCVGAAWGPVCPQQDHSAPSVGECPACTPWECPPNWSFKWKWPLGGVGASPTSWLHPCPPWGSSAPRKLTWDPPRPAHPKALHTL